MRLRTMSLMLIGMICLTSLQAQADCESGECPVEAALKQLPQMQYLVGKETTTCSKSAATLSNETGEPIKYVVAKKTFANKPDATRALAVETENLVKRFVTPTQCTASGQTLVGSAKFECSQKASATVKRIQDAIETVTVAYHVGEQVCDCPVKAKQLAAETQADIVFVVDGHKTTCPIDSRLTTARAQYRAAVEALAKG